jgi:uncharacterized protein GlcG (DUF336 family)
VDTGLGDLVERLGGCDAVVANAGVADTIHRAERFPESEWRKDLETNLSGQFNVVRALFEPLRESGDGRVVVVSSASAESGLPGQVAYTAAKAGLVGMARTLAAEWGRHGIRCNVVMPGLIATPKVLALPDAARKALTDALPLGRLGEPAELAATIRLPPLTGRRLHHGHRHPRGWRLRAQHRQPRSKLADPRSIAPMHLARARAIVDDVLASAPGPVSVFVANLHGELVAAATMDGAAPDTRLNAQRKAYTAARSDATSTRELAEKARADPVERASFDPFFTFFLGGVAVFEGSRRIGAVGVSGLPGDDDEQLALAAIERSASV